MQEFITSRREQIAELCRKHHVRRLAIFGSAVRDDFDPARSDVDVLVEFDEISVMEYSDNKHDLHDELERQFGRKVDLLTWKSIQNPYLLREVESSHELLYAA
jgi:predicted nucleotidyltransferase